MPRVFPHERAARLIIAVFKVGVIFEPTNIERNFRVGRRPGKIDFIGTVYPYVNGVFKRQRRGENLSAAIIDVFADNIHSARGRHFEIVIHLLHLYKISDSLVDRFDVHERVGIFFDYSLEIGNLMRIYYADKYFLIVVLINTDAVQTRCGMFKSVSYFVFEFVALIGDDRKLACVFQTRNYPVADNARNERVNDAQTNGFVIYNESVLVYSVHEQTCKRDDGIENKRHVKEIQVRTNNAHVLGNDIRSARGRIVFNRKADAKAHDKPRDKRRIYRIMPVGNVFEILNETYLIEQYVRQRIRHRKSQRFNGKFLFDFEKSENTERHVDKKRHVRDVEIEFVLNHDGNTVDSRRREIVRHDKKCVIESKQRA